MQCGWFVEAMMLASKRSLFRGIWEGAAERANGFYEFYESDLPTGVIGGGVPCRKLVKVMKNCSAERSRGDARSAVCPARVAFPPHGL